uniref:Uncharacterized protein n=1 Tax=Meloidogyne enterolobii TaxID=390850 RepID=A0A6V7XBA3_MELEN|nr:unnamed protein product [Meloidogyne enterolobii]
MYLKLILYILLLTIFIKFSNGELCKCDKKMGKILRNQRYKRGFSCNCFSGGAGSSKKGSDEEILREVREKVLIKAKSLQSRILAALRRTKLNKKMQ